MVGPQDAEVSSGLGNLGVLYKYTGDFDKAERAGRWTFERKLWARSSAVGDRATLAALLDGQGKHENAEELYIGQRLAVFEQSKGLSITT